MSGAPPPQPGTAGTDDDPLDIETAVLELLNTTAGVDTVENLVGVAADSTSTDGTLVYPTANGAQGVPTDLAVRIDGVNRPVTAIEYADATGTLRPVTQWHLGPLGEFTLTLDSLTFVQPATFDVRISSTTSAVAPGDTLDVAVDVTNSGDETGTQTVTLDIGGVGQVDSASVSLSGGGSTTQTLSWSVPSGQTEQDYQATVSSVDDTASQTVTVDSVPPSAVYFWDGANFATPWNDEVQTESMSITGLSATTVSGNDAVAGDGTDDFGAADISQWNPAGKAAIEVALATTNDGEVIGQRNATTDEPRIVAGIGDTSNANGQTPGVPAINWRDPNNNRNSIEGETDIADGTLTTVIWGKDGDNFSDLYITVDGSDESLTTNFNEDDGLTNIEDADISDMHFFATNDKSASVVTEHIDADVVGFAFHDTNVTNPTIL